jgi:PAS domain S-box-containing protein
MLETELEDLRALIADLHESVLICELDARIRYFNPITERMFGKSLAEARGRSLFELFPEAVGNAFHQAFERVVAEAGAESVEHYYPPLDAWFKNHLKRVGLVVHVVSRNVTEEVRRRRRLETLARISEVLTGEELDFRSATTRIARLLADVLEADCGIALLSGDGSWLELVAQRSPGGGPAAQAAMLRWSATTGPSGAALRSRNAVLAQAGSLALAGSESPDEQARAVVEAYASASILVVPLVVGEGPVGVLIATRHAGCRPLTEDDRVLGTAIAPSVGLYLAHARRQTEAASLRQRLAHLADALPALIAFVDSDNRYQYVNREYERWFKASRETFLGRTLREVMSTEMYASMAPYVGQAQAGIAVRFHDNFKYPSGARDVDVQYLPIRSGAELEGFAVLVQDVTSETRIRALEHEQLEAERRATRRLESLLALAGKLAAVSRPEEIARVVVDEGVGALETAVAGMFVLSADGRELVLLRERGFDPEQAAAFQRVSLDSVMPLTDAVKQGRPIWIESRAEYAARYPAIEARYRPSNAPPLACALMPFIVEGKAAGCLTFAFHDERRLLAAERAYLEVLASHSAEAFRRARLWTQLQDVSETREAMFQASPAAILLLDAAGVVHAWNPAAERIFGWSSGDVIGRVLPVAGDHAEHFYTNLANVLNGNIIQRQELRRRRADGEWVDIELYAAPLRLSEGRSMCLGLVVDITDRKRGERGRQLLADANAALTRSLDLSGALAALVRLPLGDFADWCCVDLLEQGDLRRVALSQQDAGRALLPLRIPHAPERGGASLAIETREPQFLNDMDDTTLRRVARDDAHLEGMRALQMRAAISVPLLASGRALGALSFASRHRNFDALDTELATALARHLATAVENARLFEDAQRARGEAEAASRAKDEFLAMLGHELRNPLAPIATALELMRMREPERLVRERDTVSRQVAHLSRLVDDLLDVSRITRGQVELRREHVELDGIVARAIEMAGPLLESRQHQLTLDLAPGLVVFADVTRLSQVVSNLLSNAAKYTAPGGHIHVRARSEADRIVLMVRDDGVGISPGMLPRIFDIFVQAPQPSARPEGGLGIGLAIVKSLVAAHGGSVQARSQGPGRGAELIVSLPAPIETTAPPRVLAKQPPDASSPRRILVVDDNEEAANLLVELLEVHGHDVRAAYDGPSALQLAERFKPEVAVLDLGLPVMDGYEVAQRLQAAGPLRLIALTGYGRSSDRERTRQAGFYAHLAKPVGIAALLPLLELQHAPAPAEVDAPAEAVDAAQSIATGG